MDTSLIMITEHTQLKDLTKVDYDRIVDSNVQRVVLKRTDMADYKQRFAVVICMQAMEHFYYYKDIAGYVKRQFDARYSPTWHCIVGKRFSSYITYEAKEYVYFLVGDIAVLLFRF